MTQPKETKKPDLKKLYKSRRDKMIDGVCGGLAEYLNIDVAIIRILWAVLIFGGGIGFLAYIIAMIIIPVNPKHTDLKEEEKVRHSPNLVWGIILLLMGILFLSHHFSPFCCRFFPFTFGFHHFWNFLFPVFLILAGLAVLSGGVVHSTQASRKNLSKSPRHLLRSVSDKKIGGVCGGIGNYFNVDSSIIRLGAVLLLLIHFIGAVMMYVVLLIFIPRENG